MPDRIVAVDVKYPLLIAATADKKITIFHLDNPSKPYRVRAAAAARTRGRSVGLPRRGPPSCVRHVHRSARAGRARVNTVTSPPAPQTMASPLKFNVRTLKAFHNRQCFALSSAEGRIAIRYVDEAMDNACVCVSMCRGRS